VLNEALAAAPYVLGGELSLADWAIAGHLTFAETFRLPVADFRRIRSWMARLDENEAGTTSAPGMAG
jgi:glutathione S-transferase